MTTPDMISRADALAAVRSVPPGTTCRGDAIIATINALPVSGQVEALVKAAQFYQRRGHKIKCAAVDGGLKPRNCGWDNLTAALSPFVTGEN